MNADETDKRPTPLTDRMREHLSHDRVHLTQQRDAAEDLCERMEQDRSALMEALNNVLDDVWNGEFWQIAEETLAAVREGMEAKNG